MEKGGSVYIMVNQHNTVLYTGVTSDLIAGFLNINVKPPQIVHGKV